MVADNNIDLTATFDTSKATDSIKKFGSEANNAIDGVNKKVDTLSSNISDGSKRKFNIDTNAASNALEGLTSKLKLFGIAAASYFSVQAIGNFFSKVISEAVDAENNLNQLNAALARNGQLTAETSKSMSDFATSMMQVSTVDDDVITGQLAIAMNFTKSASQAQELVKAAMNLSSAMKIDLGTAVELLGRTLDGTAGRLNETVPALRGVSAEALKSGEAIRVVNEQFAGAATSELNTYAGAMAQLSNVIGNFSASIGNIIIKNPMVTQAIKEISKVFTKATSAIEDGTDSSISFVNRGMTAIIGGVRELLPSINALSSFIKSLAFIFDATVKGIMSFVDGLKILGNAWLWVVGTMAGKKTALTGIEEALDRMAKRGDELTESLKNIGKDSFSKLDLKSFDDSLKRIQDAANKKPIQIETTINKPKGDVKVDSLVVKPDEVITEKFPTEMIMKPPAYESGLNPEQKRKAEFMQSFIDFGENLGPAAKTIIVSFGEVAYEISENLPKYIDAIFNSIASAVAGMAKGAEGGSESAKQLLGGLTKTFGDFIGNVLGGPIGGAIGGGIGAIIASTFDLAAIDPEEGKKKIAEFTDAFLGTIEKITENLDIILPKVAEALPKILVSVIKALPAVLSALTKAMKPIVKETIKEIPGIAQSLIDLTIEFFRFIFEGTFNAIIGGIEGIKYYFKEKMPFVSEKIAAFTAAISSSISNLQYNITNGFKSISINGFIDGFKVSLSSLGNDLAINLKNVLIGLADWGKIFSSFFSNIGSILTNGFSGLFDGSFFKSITNAINNFIGNIFSYENSSKFISKITDGIGSIFSLANINKMLAWFIYGIQSLFSGETFTKIVNTIVEGFKSLFSGLEIKTESFKVGGTLGQIGGAISGGFKSIFGKNARGGVVPNGFPDDSYPSLLTSGETIIPADTTPNLFRLIDNLSSNRTSINQDDSAAKETNLLLKQLITMMANQNTTIDVKLERDTLAKAILSLNQNNRRLA